jgi:hypothetical protein
MNVPTVDNIMSKDQEVTKRSVKFLMSSHDQYEHHIIETVYKQ